MGPFDVNPDWFDKYWYSPEQEKTSWRVSTAVVGMVAIVIAGWFA